MTRSHRTPVVAHALRRLVLASAIAVPFTLVSSAPPSAGASCGSFQRRVDYARWGSTITIPRCVFHQTVTVRKRLTINAYGATIDGDNVRAGLRILASDVTVNGLTVRRVRTGLHGGAVWVSGVNRFTFRDGVARDSNTICLSLNGGTGHRIIHSELTGCGKEGYFTNGVSYSSFMHNHIHHNNRLFRFDPEVEAGGGKSMAGRGLTFYSNSVHDNGGPGIWFDNGMHDVVVRSNRVYRNDRAGIFFEISSGAKIYSNKVWGNGFGKAAWGYGAGITISSSDYADVHDNVVAWNARGISVISQARGPAPHNGNVVHDNVIVQRSGRYVAGFYDDHGGSLFRSANGNIGYRNTYWVAGSEPASDRFQWAGGRRTLIAYNGTPGESGGRYLSLVTRNSILTTARIPLTYR